MAAGRVCEVIDEPGVGGVGRGAGREGPGWLWSSELGLPGLGGQVRNDRLWRRLNASAISVAHGHVASIRKMRRRPVLTRRPAACQMQ